jgi:hypothetical protein
MAATLNVERQEGKNNRLLRKAKAPAMASLSLALLLTAAAGAHAQQADNTVLKANNATQTEQSKPKELPDKVVPRPTHTYKDSLYKASKITAISGILLDYSSSVGFSTLPYIKEADPVFQTSKGYFDISRASVIMIGGTILALEAEHIAVKHHPRTRPLFTVVNFGIGSCEAFVGIRNIGAIAYVEGLNLTGSENAKKAK